MTKHKTCYITFTVVCICKEGRFLQTLLSFPLSKSLIVVLKSLILMDLQHQSFKIRLLTSPHNKETINKFPQVHTNKK